MANEAGRPESTAKHALGSGTNQITQVIPTEPTRQERSDNKIPLRSSLAVKWSSPSASEQSSSGGSYAGHVA